MDQSSEHCRRVVDREALVACGQFLRALDKDAQSCAVDEREAPRIEDGSPSGSKHCRYRNSQLRRAGEIELAVEDHQRVVTFAKDGDNETRGLRAGPCGLFAHYGRP